MTSAAITLERLLATSERHLAGYLRLTEGLPHEMKGIRRSEMFFLYATVADLAPVRIIESGRARAQSTLILSLLFPAASIISIESDATSPDAAVAADRLKDRNNVECRFGDSRLMLPAILSPNDIVLIDGPKDFRAVKLALRLLRTGKPAAVFVHDLWPESPARDFVDSYLPTVFLSDDPEWVRRYSRLDSKKRTPPGISSKDRMAYGATLACFTPNTKNHSLLLFQCGLAQGFERIRETIRKVCRRPARARPKDFSVVAARER